MLGLLMAKPWSRPKSVRMQGHRRGAPFDRKAISFGAARLWPILAHIVCEKSALPGFALIITHSCGPEGLTVG